MRPEKKDEKQAPGFKHGPDHVPAKPREAPAKSTSDSQQLDMFDQASQPWGGRNPRDLTRAAKAFRFRGTGPPVSNATA